MDFPALPPWLKTIGYALALSTGFELLHYIRNSRLFQRNGSKRDQNEGVEVMFFPDEKIACEAHFSYGCSNKACWHSHEATSAMKVYQFIESANRTLDVCVYCIASQNLVDVVLKVHEQGVIVRVLTDQAQALEQGTQIERLRSSGVYTQQDTNYYFNHSITITIYLL